MKSKKLFIAWGMLAAALTFALVLAGCSKKDSGGESASGSGGSAKVVTGGKEAKETDFIYELNKTGDGVIITGYQEDAAGGDVVIPAKIEGYLVVAVIYGFGAGFEDGLSYYDKRPLTAAEIKAKGLRPAITSIVFPDSITEIRPTQGNNWYFFNMNFHLKSIAFPKNLKAIPAAFANNVSTLTAIKWPESLEEIGRVNSDGAVFSGAGFTELVIPEGVKTIGRAAFGDCKNLTSVTIPDSVETIGRGAFADCPVLATVNVSAHTIKYPSSDFIGAFRGCPKLTGIAVRKAIQDTGYNAEWF
ncbi:MAG: leucine-rich repeat domain-containing protein [Treponema sp.]|jgi:hypothetical protein|nr:leucine-rich repeat domain-containing protein [Treponema sp.]